jgi:hypothetical protein
VVKGFSPSQNGNLLQPFFLELKRRKKKKQDTRSEGSRLQAAAKVGCDAVLDKRKPVESESFSLAEHVAEPETTGDYG